MEEENETTQVICFGLTEKDYTPLEWAILLATNKICGRRKNIEKTLYALYSKEVLTYEFSIAEIADIVYGKSKHRDIKELRNISGRILDICKKKNYRIRLKSSFSSFPIDLFMWYEVERPGDGTDLKKKPMFRVDLKLWFLL